MLLRWLSKTYTGRVARTTECSHIVGTLNHTALQTLSGRHPSGLVLDHELLHGLQHAREPKEVDSGGGESHLGDILGQLFDLVGVLEDGDGGPRYQLLVSAYCEQKVFDADLGWRLGTVRAHHHLARFVDAKLDGQVALGANLGEHGSPVLRNHGARLSLEKNDGCGLLRVPLYRDVGARELKEEVEAAAVVERAKKLGYERPGYCEVARNARLVDDIAYGNTRLVVKKLGGEVLPHAVVLLLHVGLVELLVVEQHRKPLVHFVQTVLGLDVQGQVVEAEWGRQLGLLRRLMVMRRLGMMMVMAGHHVRQLLLLWSRLRWWWAHHR